MSNTTRHRLLQSIDDLLNVTWITINQATKYANNSHLSCMLNGLLLRINLADNLQMSFALTRCMMNHKWSAHRRDAYLEVFWRLIGEDLLKEKKKNKNFEGIQWLCVDSMECHLRPARWVSDYYFYKSVSNIVNLWEKKACMDSLLNKLINQQNQINPRMLSLCEVGLGVRKAWSWKYFMRFSQ